MRHSKRTKIKDMEDSEFTLQRVTKSPLDENHWSYIQKRFHMTPRELQVAQLTCQGFNNNKIAKTLKARTGTVKTHLRNIYRKIRVKSKIEMLLKFINSAAKFSAKSRITPPIAIIDIKKSIKMPSETTKMDKKAK